MSVLDRSALEASPLADLHALASELSLDGYRRLRKADLIDAIVARQDGGAEEETAAASAEEESAGARRRRGRRGGRGRRSAGEEDADSAQEAEAGEAVVAADADAEPSRASTRRARSGRASASAGQTGGRSGPRETKARSRRGEPAEDSEAAEEETIIEGAVELLANGSGFVRVSPPEPTDDDVYISAAQVKRCELVSGDRVSGPQRAPRRSERFPSLVRVDTINGRPASELADGTRFDELPAAFPTERFRLGSEDATLKALEWLTPFGRGSRVTITGAARAGKSHAIRQLADALAAQDGLSVFVALAGVRPEEISEWATSPVSPAGAISFAASADAQAHVVELVVDQAKRVASRGAHAVVLIDTLDGLHPGTAHKLLAAARNIVDGGSLTVIAASNHAVGGETTVIALDALLTSTARLPALDLVTSGTLRPELLVGEAGAKAIAEARAAALDQ